MALVAIDMTPLRPGGENGGVKLLVLELIKGFQEISKNNRFLLLTASWNDQELSYLDSGNTQRLCVLHKQDSFISSGLSRIFNKVMRRLPRIRQFLNKLRGRKRPREGILSQIGVDVLFCPFTAPTYAEPCIPVITLICDLQHKDYPQFFGADEIYVRNTFLSDVQRMADAVICISESTRKSVIHHLKMDPDKTFTVPICIQSRLAGSDLPDISRHLRDMNIDVRPYMFYPANFWPHKNHRLLLTAYGMFVARHPESTMDLVFTGALDEAQKELQDNVNRMGLGNRVHFLGYLPDEQLLAVWKGCSLLIFPSLYEGFGIPVLEAMQFGKPVLCSNVTSLPEVAGNAAIYFDPRKPDEIVQCLERIIDNHELCADMVRRGWNQLSYFQTWQMVEKYLQIIEEAINYPRKFYNGVKGIHSDGWTSKMLDVTYSPVDSDRNLELSMAVPEGVPYRKATIMLDTVSGKKHKWHIARGGNLKIRLPLLEKGGGCLSFSIEPGFVPSECGVSNDDRLIGVICKECLIVSSNGKQIELWSDKLP